MSEHVVEGVLARFWPVYWTCGSCHASFPKDYEGDWCDGCDQRLRRNDDVRISLAEALPREPFTEAA